MAWYNQPPANNQNQQPQYTQDPRMQQPTNQYPRNSWDQPTTPMASLGSVMSGTNTQTPATVTYSFPGRPVENEDEIKAGEIPMDGTLCLFPKKDLSVIYAKAWNAKGTIDTVPYMPKMPEPQKASPDIYQQEILNRLSNLETFLQQALAQKPNPPAKKPPKTQQEEAAG